MDEKTKSEKRVELCKTCKHENSDKSPGCKKKNIIECNYYEVHMTKAEGSQYKKLIAELAKQLAAHWTYDNPGDPPFNADDVIREIKSDLEP